MSKLTNQYQKMGTIMKIGFWGSIASIIALAITLLPIQGRSDTNIHTDGDKSPVIGENKGNITINYDSAPKPMKDQVIDKSSNKQSQISHEKNSPNIISNGDVNVTYNSVKDKKFTTLGKPLPESTGDGWLTDIFVKVSLSNSGNTWDKVSFIDKQGSPDIAICISYSSGKKICDPPRELMKGWGAILKMKCRNSYQCNFSNFRIIESKFTINVLNVNQGNPELISSGECELNKKCILDKAVVIPTLVTSYY